MGPILSLTLLRSKRLGNPALPIPIGSLEYRLSD